MTKPVAVVLPILLAVAAIGSQFKGGGGMAYFDTDKVGGVLTELVEWPEKS